MSAVSDSHDQEWRRSLAWAALCRQVYAEESVCWLCLQPVDFTAPPRTKWSRSVDHVKAVTTHPHLVLVRANLRLAHYSCNSRKGNQAVAAYEPSREW